MPDEVIEFGVGKELRNLVEDLVARGLTYKKALACWRREWLLAELNRARGNQCAAARRMGVHRNTVGRKLHQAEIRINVKRPGRRGSHLARILTIRKEENNAA